MIWVHKAATSMIASIANPITSLEFQFNFVRYNTNNLTVLVLNIIVLSIINRSLNVCITIVLSADLLVSLRKVQERLISHHNFYIIYCALRELWH